jgi:MinD-like ATPase involved in chromosome partitioning or flagellar assembly
VLPEEMTSLVEMGSSLFDYVILDTPGALSDTVEAAVSSADHLLVVTSLEITSVKNTSLLLAALGQQHYPPEQILVVANHTHPRVGQHAVDLAATLERDSIWEVPFDSAVRRGSQDGQPPVLSHPSAPASRSLRALARRLVDEPGCLDRRRIVRLPRMGAGARLRLPFTLRRAS